MNDEAEFWFARVDIDVARDNTLSVTTRFIFMILCTFADKDNRGCWPSNDAIAKAAGVSKSTVIRACKELEARGVIARFDRFNDCGSLTLKVGRSVWQAHIRKPLGSPWGMRKAMRVVPPRTMKYLPPGTRVQSSCSESF